MPTDLQAVLRMRKPRGRHVGVAMLLNLVNDYVLADIPHEPLFSQDKLSRMVSTFTSDLDLQVYSNYADIISGADHLFDYNEYCIHQIMHGFYRLDSVMSKISSSLKLHQAIAEAGLETEPAAKIFSALKSHSDIIADREEREFLKISYESLIFPAMRALLAFDAFMDILAEVTEIPEMSQIKSRSAYAIETISLLNHIAEGEFPGMDGQTLLTLFPPVDISALYPSAYRIAELKKHLSPINRERCPSLRRLKFLVLSLCDEGGRP